jgi:eukaryotic-like serine/threonine-protein kinase
MSTPSDPTAPDDSLATAVERPPRRAGDDPKATAVDQLLAPPDDDAPPRARVASRPASSSSSLTSPAESLRHEEIASTGRFVLLIFAMTAALLASLPLLGGDPLAKRIFAAGLLVAAGAGLWLSRLLARPERYAGSRAALSWGLCTAGVLTGVYYFGAFSSAPALLCLGIYFIALGHSRATAFLVYAMCAGFQALLASAIITGAIADPGMMRPAPSLTTSQVAMTQVLVQLCQLGALLLGRASRKAKLEALVELEQAKQAVVERENLLEEAREDLDRALRLGDVGRYTGDTVGSFRLGAVIGRGAMGDVYEAVHARTGELAAVKLIQPERLERGSYLARFVRELEIAASLSAPNIVRVLEIGDRFEAQPYLAMERLTGHDLATHLRQRSQLPAADALTLARQAGAGVDAAARAGVIHRDLKPQNLFLHEPEGGAPIWKILDFGVSKLAGSGGTLTRGHIIGTPAYMAPEQARAEPVDHRADIYSLGAILYRAVTGRRPFRGRSVAQTIYAVVHTMPPRPSEVAPVPRALDAVLAIALSKDRSARFDSAGELARALDEALAGACAPELEVRARDVLRRDPWGSPGAWRPPRGGS